MLLSLFLLLFIWSKKEIRIKMEITRLDKIAWRIDFKDYTEMIEFAELILHINKEEQK